jgi:hypothetical protein
MSPFQAFYGYLSPRKGINHTRNCNSGCIGNDDLKESHDQLLKKQLKMAKYIMKPIVGKGKTNGEFKGMRFCLFKTSTL